MNDQDTTHTGAVEALTEPACLALLTTSSVGQIAFVNAEGQQLIPVNFIVLDGLVFFRTARTGVLAAFERGHDDVAFGVDHHDEATRRGWNVTVRGSARRVEDRAGINKVLGSAGLEPWAGGVRSMVIEVRPRSIAGRRVFDAGQFVPPTPGEADRP